MSTFDAVLIGALGAAGMLFILAATCWLVWKVFPLLERLATNLAALTDRAKAIWVVLGHIERELAYMRSLAPPPNLGPEGQSAPDGTPLPSAPPAPIQYPAPAFDRFIVVPDATVADTDIGLLNQTDADLTELEKLETMRQQGIEVEDSNAAHEGIEVDSE